MKVIEIKDLVVTYDLEPVLENVNLEIEKGDLMALVGLNGAGKSTLMKCLFGIYKKDTGTIKLEGKVVNFLNSKNALEHGVSMVHQELNQVLQRNVMDNIWLRRYPVKYGMVDEKKMHEDTLEIFTHLDINIDPSAKVSTLSVSQMQML
ncbi:ATP-binding cassette domain-containing protein [Acinetobacter baumannii]|nr:ATP-binding cassette domain-containing protein [Acinetobacter baumannii]